MFPRYRGGPGAGRGLVLVVLAVVLGTAVLLVSGNRSWAPTSRLETTQASVSPSRVDVQVEDGAPPASDMAGAGPLVPSTTTPASPAPAAEPAPGPLPTHAPTSAPTSASTSASPHASNQAPVSGAQPGSSTGSRTASVPAPPPGDSVATTAAPTPTSIPVERSGDVVTATTTKPPAPAARSGPTRAPGAEAEVVPLTNRDRSGEGLGTLSRNACLDSVASRYAEQMARSGVLAHNPGAGPAVIGCQPGATWGDNVGTSAPCDAALLEREWMASPSHRKNILTDAFRQIGVGAWTDEQGGCWVQVLFSS